MLNAQGSVRHALVGLSYRFLDLWGVIVQTERDEKDEVSKPVLRKLRSRVNEGQADQPNEVCLPIHHILHGCKTHQFYQLLA